MTDIFVEAAEACGEMTGAYVKATEMRGAATERYGIPAVWLPELKEALQVLTRG